MTAGFVYVLKFATGAVKIGSTACPSRRIGEHRRNAYQLGTRLVDVWLSQPSAEYVWVEGELLDRVRKAGFVRLGREWFRGLDFQIVIRMACALMDGNVVEDPPRAPQALSPEARTALDLALTFPAFQVPGIEHLHELHKEIHDRTGAKYRPFGINRLKTGNSELKTKGFYGIRRAALGRAGKRATVDGPRLAFARSYGNEPHKHLRALNALTDQQILAHDRATKESWARYCATGHFLHQRSNVLPLDDHRRRRAG